MFPIINGSELRLKDDEVLLTVQRGSRLVHVIAKKPKPVPVAMEHGSYIDAEYERAKDRFLCAIECGNKQELLNWLSRYPCLVNTEIHGMSALCIAARLNNPYFVNILLEHGADVDITTKNKNSSWPSLFNMTPLHYAASQGFDRIITALLAYVPDLEIYNSDYETALHVAIKNGHVSTAELLLQHGANANALARNGRTSLHIAAEEKHTQLIDLLKQYQKDINAPNCNNWTPLHVAIFLNCTEFVQQILKYKPNLDMPNNKQITPLITAVQQNNAAIVQLLLDHGADPNKVDSSGHNALYYAIYNDNSVMIRLLAKYRIDINCCGKTTSLAEATWKGRCDIVSTLIELGADMHLRGEKDGSGLNQAVLSGKDWVVQLLLNNSHDKNAAEEYMQGLRLAEAKKYYSIMKLFLDHGGCRYVAGWQEQLAESLRIAFNNKEYEKVSVYLQYDIPLPAKCIHKAIADTQTDIVRTLVFYKNVDLTERSQEGLLPEQIPTCREISKLLTVSIPNARHMVQAIDQGNYQEFVTYLNKPVELTYKDANGNTPLHHAAMYGHVQMIKHLLALGADPTIKNKDGMTAVHYAANIPQCLGMFMHAATDQHVVDTRLASDRIERIYKHLLELDDMTERKQEFVRRAREKSRHVSRIITNVCGIGIGIAGFINLYKHKTSMLLSRGARAALWGGIAVVAHNLINKYLTPIINKFCLPTGWLSEKPERDYSFMERMRDRLCVPCDIRQLQKNIRKQREMIYAAEIRMRREAPKSVHRMIREKFSEYSRSGPLKNIDTQGLFTQIQASFY